MERQQESPQPAGEEMIEIDLKEGIRLLWKSKWFIGALIFIAMILAIVFTFMTEEVQYEARSELLLMPPRYTEIRVARISRGTYQNLARTDDLINRIIKELDLRDEEGELLSPDDIEDRMEIVPLTLPEEEFDIGDDISDLSHLFRLSVTSSDPEEASQIANTWAELFTEDTLDIRRAETEEVFKVTERRFKEVKQRLNDAQDDLQDVKERVRLEQLRPLISSYRSNLSEAENKLLSYRQQLGEKEIELLHVEEILSEMEDEHGQWLWEDILGEGEFRREDMEEAVANYFKLRNELHEFEEKYDLTAKRRKLSFLTNLLSNRRNTLESLKAEYARVKADYEELNSVLADEPSRWRLERSLTDDSFWENVFSPEELEVLSEMVLETEQINSVYQRLRGERADKTVQINSLPEKIDYYEEEVVGLEAETEELRLYISELETEKSDIKDNLRTYRRFYSQWRSRFENFKKEYSDLDISLSELDKKVGFYTNRRDELKEELDEMEERLWKYETEKENIERDISSYEKTYERLMSRIEEARLAQAEQTSDVRFLSEAVPPGRTVGRGTTLNMIIAAFLAGIFGIFIVFFKEYIDMDEEE